MVRKVVIAGAAGRDFHNFNVLYRHDASVRVMAFTATQIPDIDGRSYPAALAGAAYPDGIPIESEADLEAIVRRHGVDQVDFAYSDVSHEDVMHVASRALAAGADFHLVAPRRTALPVDVPVVSVCAVRTGCGKSQTSRAICRILKGAGRRVVAVRHPMPYGDLAAQANQRFAVPEDMDRHRCTLEEREEYDEYIAQGLVVYAGVDYQAILERARQEADVLVWDGGNNDTPFFLSDLHVVVLDPLRAGHERQYHPGEVNLLMADVFVINKVGQATDEALAQLETTVQRHNPGKPIIRARSELVVDQPSLVSGKRVLVVEDGPTTTHGGMAWGAGWVAAQQFGAAEVVDPRPFARGSIAQAYEDYPHLGQVVPALGYTDEQLAELQQTLNNSDCDTILMASPVDLSLVLDVDKPTVRVRYRLDERSENELREIIRVFLAR